MLIPQPIQLRTFPAPRRIPAARLIRRPADHSRLRTILRSEAYAILLRIEVAAEEARVHLMASDDVAASRAVREILSGACLVGRDLQRLKTLP